MIQFCLNKLKKNPDQLFGYFILFMKLNYEVPILVTQKLTVDFLFTHTSQKSLLILQANCVRFQLLNAEN